MTARSDESVNYDDEFEASFDHDFSQVRWKWTSAGERILCRYLHAFAAYRCSQFAISESGKTFGKAVPSAALYSSGLHTAPAVADVAVTLEFENLVRSKE